MTFKISQNKIQEDN